MTPPMRRAAIALSASNDPTMIAGRAEIVARDEKNLTPGDERRARETHLAETINLLWAIFEFAETMPGEYPELDNIDQLARALLAKLEAA